LSAPSHSPIRASQPATLTTISVALMVSLAACGPARGPSGVDRSPVAQQWLDRAKASYAAVDVDDARDAIRSAVQAAPNDMEIRTWGGRIALARLEYAEAVRLLTGVNTSDARGLRGRARWYGGEIEAAADELEAMLQDPQVHDGWAKAIAGLARRGAGRKPFEMGAGLLAVSEMPRIPNSSAMLVPIEIDGDQALAMVATGTAEVTLDSATRKEPSWVNLRFAGRIEVKDVPAMVQDLSGISRQMNIPIKALLGVNLLRHLNVTFDYVGGQFVVRSFVPPFPPSATRIPVAYVRGGGMLMHSTLSADKNARPAALLLDSSMAYPVALDQEGWKKAGIDATKLPPVPQDAKLKQGVIPMLKLGAFDIPQVPAVFGTPIAEIERGMEIDLDGVVGSGLLAAFRVTLTDGGRAMWLEDIPAQQDSLPEGAPQHREGAGGSPAATPPAGAASGAASSPTTKGAAPAPGSAPKPPPTPKSGDPKTQPRKPGSDGPPMAQ
jgi:hypothetical protein